MKWLFVCLAVFCIVAPAMAGEDPYMAIVGNDNAFTSFYFSAKHQQFMYDHVSWSIPVCDPSNAALLPAYGVPIPLITRDPSTAAAGCEQFRAQTQINQPEVCDVAGTGSGPRGINPPFFTRGRLNAKTPAGNVGFYEWYIRLPKKPSGEINIVIQCGVLKAEGFNANSFNAIEQCAAETGERYQGCSRTEVDPGVNPLIITALPKLTVVAYPGPYADPFFTTGFNLTAFKNPSTYTLAFGADPFPMSNSTNAQILDGTTATRILLKACMDKSVVAKLPVTGQINANGQTEYDLEQGDIIKIRLDVPRQNTVDIYCHAQSARLAGVGEGPF